MPFRCSGLHARYTDELNEFSSLFFWAGSPVLYNEEPWPRGLGKLLSACRAGDR
jgi:hypothetical protein